MANEKRQGFAMLRKPGAQIAQPTGTRVVAADDRIDVLGRAMEQAHGTRPPVAKAQRSRENMVSFSVWMKPEGRKALKGFCLLQKDETMEAFTLRALNELLAKEGADFQIE